MKRLRILEVLGVLVLLGWTGLAHATLVSRIDGFFSPDDGLLHAIVGTSDKKVYDVTWTDGSAPTITLLHQFNTLIQDVAGYYSPNDHNRHAIVALIDNTVWEIYYRPSIGVFVDQLATINPSYGEVSSVAGHVDHNNYQNVVIGTYGPSGSYAFVLLLRWYSGKGVQFSELAIESGGVTDVASLCDDNGTDHAIALVNTGSVVQGYSHSFHDVQYTGLGSGITIGGDSLVGGGSYPNSLYPGIGAFNWLNDSYEIVGPLLPAAPNTTLPTELYDWLVYNNGYVAITDDITDPWGIETGAGFYQANGWCPNRHMLHYNGAGSILDHEKNACFPNSAWKTTYLANNFDF